jgi:hypothetical protein
MIRTSVFLAILFVLLLTVERTVIWVLPGWIASIPLMMTAGFLVMQRAGIPEGVAWFCMLALLRGDIIAGTIAFVGPFLILKVFSTRSLYALFGIGLVSYAMGILALLMIHAVATNVLSYSWGISFGAFWLQEALLIPSLYLGVSILWWFKETIGSRVALKPLT